MAGPFPRLSAPMLAHTTLPGAGDFLNGLVHPAFTPAHALLLLALGWWLAQRRPLQLRWPLLALSASAVLGLWQSGRLPPTWHPELFLALGTLLLAAAVAWGTPPASGWQALAAAGVGLLLGADSPPDGAAARPGLVLMGTWLALWLLVLNVSFYTSLLPEKLWARTAVRIGGAWLAAISFLMLALAWREGR